MSVIIPAFNSSEYIAQAIESVLAQTYVTFEIVVVDDGSTDETAEVVRRFGEGVRYVYQPNAGPGRARNRGVEETNGELLAFLDADDLWLPEKLERQVAVFGDSPELGMVTTMEQWFEHDGVLHDIPGKRERLFGHGHPARGIFLRSGVGTPTIMMPRRVFESLGGFDEDLRIAEDDHLWIRLATRYPIELIEEVLVLIRKNPASLTRHPEYRERMFRDILSTTKRLAASPEVAARIGDVVPLKLSWTYRDLGYFLFDEGRTREARHALGRAIAHRPQNLRAWRYWLLSLLPGRLIRRLRAAKQRRSG